MAAATHADLLAAVPSFGTMSQFMEDATLVQDVAERHIMWRVSWQSMLGTGGAVDSYLRKYEVNGEPFWSEEHFLESDDALHVLEEHCMGTDVPEGEIRVLDYPRFMEKIIESRGEGWRWYTMSEFIETKRSWLKHPLKTHQAWRAMWVKAVTTERAEGTQPTIFLGSTDFDGKMFWHEALYMPTVPDAAGLVDFEKELNEEKEDDEKEEGKWEELLPPVPLTKRV
jgi:hypothetical protein